MDVINITAESRENTGTKWAKQARREGRIPCVLYGGGESHHFTLSHHEVKPLVYTDQFKKAEIEIDGKSHSCILKSLQLHPITDQVTHLDFLRLIDGHPIDLEIPIRFKGLSPGVKNGGVFVDKLRSIKIKLLPDSLISELFVDISEMKLGDTVRVKDVLGQSGLEVLSSPNAPIASVIVPRALKDAELDEEEDEEGEDAEGEEGDAETEESAS